MKSPYKEYAEYKAVEIYRARPSLEGFLRRYILGALSIIVYLFSYLIVSFYGVDRYLMFLYLMFTFLFLIVSWVLRSKEALSSLLIGIFLVFLFGYNDLNKINMTNFYIIVIDIFKKYSLISSIISSLIVLFMVEVYRRSIEYILTDTSVIVKGGIWRTQYHSLPYNQIGRVILEQSFFGKLLNYGTIILVSSAEWGAEYYSRGVDTSLQKKGISLGVQYIRTLKEVSRDPLKSLYGVKKPFLVRDVIEKMITAPFRAEIDQARYLKEIRDMLKKD